MSAALQTSRRLEYMLLAGTALLYVVVTILSHRPDLIWDEGRYLWYGNNLLHGFYTMPGKPDIVNGPGYPLVLAGLQFLNVPLMGMRMFNAIFMALAGWFTFRTVLPYAGKRWALAVALVLILHPSLVRTTPYLMTEALAVCCIAGFAWAFTEVQRSEVANRKLMMVAAFAFAWLIMTRVFFGNVMMASMFFIVLFLPFWKTQRRALLRSFAVLAMAFAMCGPWLVFTKLKTGENLCWSTNGGELLYWATSTNEGENGHWFSEEDAQNLPALVANGHRDFYQKHYYLPVEERETALKKKAFENIRANPVGVLKNWVCNWCRLVFRFPRSYHMEDLLTVLLVVANGPILFAILLTCWIGWRHRREIPVEVLLLMGMTFIYLGGTSLLPGLPRYTAVIWPWVGVGIAVVLSKHLRVRLGR